MTASRKSTLVELVDQARKGDDDAREQLFGRCRNYLRVVAQAHVESSLRRKVDASDLVQQTLLEAHQGLAQFHGTTSAQWLAWLRRIVIHNAADFVRHYCQTDKRQQRREVALQIGAADSARTAGWEPADPGASPSAVVLQWEREVQLADAMTLLSKDHREVITLRSLERLPFDEVARRMGRSRPAVQMLWMRAIRCLQASLEGDD